MSNSDLFKPIRKFKIDYEYESRDPMFPFKKTTLEVDARDHEHARSIFDDVVSQRKWRKPKSVKISQHVWGWD